MPPSFAAFVRKLDPRGTNKSPRIPHSLRRQRTRKAPPDSGGSGGGGRW